MPRHPVTPPSTGARLCEVTSPWSRFRAAAGLLAATSRVTALLVGLVTASVVLVAGTAVAAGPYPDPAPDFPDLGGPHAPFFSPTGGQTDRALLVIFAEFNDLTFDDTNPASIDAAHLADRFFGGFPSVAGYFADDSNGQLQLTAAPESDAANGGAVDDGVVSVSVDMDKSDFLQLGRSAEQKLLLQAADPDVDYRQFDRDGNDRVTQDELVLVRQDVDPSPVPVGSGTARRPDAVTLDGVQLGGSNNLKGVDAGTATNLMTLVHEIGHAAFDMPDLYFWGVGHLDLAGPTADVADTTLFRTNAWQRLHLGWSTPTVVTEDGYYTVPRSPAPDGAFVLYDPDAGTSDYFVVENRARTPDTYDQGASDTGLVIWRVDEDEYHPTGGGQGVIALMRPDGQQTGNGYGGSSTDAWDPSDANTPQRTMQGRAWRDGTPSNVAVRAVPAAGGPARVYFDVRGPGILVDPHTAQGRPLRVDVTPEEVNPPPVPVRNTGESTDTFTVDYEGLPPGWTSQPDTLELDADEETVAQAGLIPAADAATGVHEVTVLARSDTDGAVNEQATFQVNVVLDDTDIAYTGQTYGPIGEPAGFRARVTNPDDADTPPVAGVEVTFTLTGAGGTQQATTTTDGDGVASADPLVDLPPGDYQLEAITPRSGKHAPAATTVDYRVPTAAERIQDLRDDVTSADLPDGIERSMTKKLDKALAHLDTQRFDAACNTLQAFINETAAQRGNHVAAPTADQLIHDAEGIRAQIGCRN